MIADTSAPSILDRRSPNAASMAFAQPPPTHLSEVQQLPIVLVPDCDDDDEDEDNRRAGSGLELDTRPRQEEPPPPPVPQHPMPSMQHAFAESLIESTKTGGAAKPKLRTGDAKARREALLDGGARDPPPTALWRFRPGQMTHELCRLMAQISFGVYLLLNGMANSQLLVVSILQGHIDEVDEFLETTLEDVDLATRDVEDRIKHLKLPMDNISVFERMLEERRFRAQILDGNRKIDHIVARTQAALDQTNTDLAEGLAATRDFTIYLAEQQHGSWRRERPDVIDIYDAMKGNTDGWFNAFMDLQAKCSALNALIVRLTDMVAEMDRRAGEAERRTQERSHEVQAQEVRSQETSSQSARTPQHSPRPSDASSSIITTPPASPPIKVPNSPPRLSLRLSIIDTGDFSIDTELVAVTEEQDRPAEKLSDERLSEQKPTEEKPSECRPNEDKPSENEGAPRKSVLEVTSRSPPPEESPPASPPPASPTEEHRPLSPPTRDPRRLSKSPSVLLDVPRIEAPQEETLKEQAPQEEPPKEEEPEEEEPSKEEPPKKEPSKEEPSKGQPETGNAEAEKEDSPLYMLQPRTYTPVPPSPLPSPRPDAQPKRPPPPSPRVAERPQQPSPRATERPKKELEVRVQQRPRGTSPRPPVEVREVETRRPTTSSSESSVESAAQVTLTHAQPRVEQVRSMPQVFKPRVVEIGAKAEGRTGSRPAARRPQQPLLGPNFAQAPEVVIPADPEVATAEAVSATTSNLVQRTSLRQRVSLKTTPPESIQVPPPQKLNLQPVHGGLQRAATYQAPDSAYGSDMERGPVNPMASASSIPSLADFKPPFAQQANISIPSPLSDRQFFRPVQASPHSPLQQQAPPRPHTSGTVGPHHIPVPPPRCPPSAMGMSFVSSSGGTMAEGKAVKKKRSAFGWLKKAFALDEEERMAFEQRRQQQIENLYLQPKSQEFLDGKRIRPRQDHY
ncbi:hypothetical protein VTJ83DRAFT_2243 [Remersonia thermophila]|uniref:Uncharacterized protein n=1 Tax=Remersonia thermophila TaxID=72144 RepID=A0ABR4DKH6_9PEZI